MNTESALIAADPGCPVLPTAAGAVLSPGCERGSWRQEGAASRNRLLLQGNSRKVQEEGREGWFREQKCNR